MGQDNQTGSMVFIDGVGLSPAFQPPVLSSVQLIAPVDGASYASGAPVTLAAIVTTNGNAIDDVQFIADQTNLIGQAEWPYTSTWSNAAVGAHGVFARVVFNGGGIADSPPANVFIDYPTPSIGFKRRNDWPSGEREKPHRPTSSA